MSKPNFEGFEERAIETGHPNRYLVGGSGPPLVLVHGLGGMASNWRLVAPALAAARRVIVPELPGHGGSAPLRGAASARPVRRGGARGGRGRGRACRRPGWGTRSAASSALRAAVRRPEAVTGLVLAAAAGISSASAGGRGDGDAARRRCSRAGCSDGGAAVSRSRLGRTLAFGWWGVADPAGLDPEMAEAFLAGPPQHTDTLDRRARARRDRPARRSRPRWLPVPLPLGRARQLGAARRTAWSMRAGCARRCARSPTAGIC